MTNDEQHQRWLAALHEAGHATAYLSLLGRATVSRLGPDGSGVCYRKDIAKVELSFNLAVVIAAGPAAERLAQSWPAPDGGGRALPTFQTDDDGGTDQRIASLASEGCAPHAAWPQDSGGARFGGYAIWWVSAVEKAARHFVELHELSIVTAAHELFMRGVLETEHLQPTGAERIHDASDWQCDGKPDALVETSHRDGGGVSQGFS